jgi:hypothetical protein
MPSHVIRRFTYDVESQVLDILFVTGRNYRYFDVPPGVAQAMRGSFAKGEFFNARIRDRYRVERSQTSEPDLFTVRKVSE